MIRLTPGFPETCFSQRNGVEEHRGDARTGEGAKNVIRLTPGLPEACFSKRNGVEENRGQIFSWKKSKGLTLDMLRKKSTPLVSCLRQNATTTKGRQVDIRIKSIDLYHG